MGTLHDPSPLSDGGSRDPAANRPHAASVCARQRRLLDQCWTAPARQPHSGPHTTLNVRSRPLTPRSHTSCRAKSCRSLPAVAARLQQLHCLTFDHRRPTDKTRILRLSCPVLMPRRGWTSRRPLPRPQQGTRRMGKADGSAGPMGTRSRAVFMAASAARRRSAGTRGRRCRHLPIPARPERRRRSPG
jgi:hypothetical protein